jgi:hypothetical protein
VLATRDLVETFVAATPVASVRFFDLGNPYSAPATPGSLEVRGHILVFTDGDMTADSK